MPMPQLADQKDGMTLRGLIFWGLVCVLGTGALAAMYGPDAPVLSLKQGLGTEVQTTRL